VANHYTDLYKNKVNPDDVFLTTGGSLALWLSLNVLAGPGDNFLFP
jgi:aspartate/methionine/tyrosine aminotransferase